MATKFKQITLSILLANNALAEYISGADLKVGKNGGTFVGNREVASRKWADFGIVLPRGGMIFPQHEVAEVRKILCSVQEKKQKDKKQDKIKEIEGKLSKYVELLLKEDFMSEVFRNEDIKLMAKEGYNGIYMKKELKHTRDLIRGLCPQENYDDYTYYDDFTRVEEIILVWNKKEYPCTKDALTIIITQIKKEDGCFSKKEDVLKEVTRNCIMKAEHFATCSGGRYICAISIGVKIFLFSPKDTEYFFDTKKEALKAGAMTYQEAVMAKLILEGIKPKNKSVRMSWSEGPKLMGRIIGGDSSEKRTFMGDIDITEYDNGGMKGAYEDMLARFERGENIVPEGDFPVASPVRDAIEQKMVDEQGMLIL